MTINELIDRLLEVSDKELVIRVGVENDTANYWLYDLEVVPTGSSGYELGGELILKVSE